MIWAQVHLCSIGDACRKVIVKYLTQAASYGGKRSSRLVDFQASVLEIRKRSSAPTDWGKLSDWALSDRGSFLSVESWWAEATADES